MKAICLKQRLMSMMKKKMRTKSLLSQGKEQRLLKKTKLTVVKSKIRSVSCQWLSQMRLDSKMKVTSSPKKRASIYLKRINLSPVNSSRHTMSVRKFHWA